YLRNNPRHPRPQSTAQPDHHADHRQLDRPVLVFPQILLAPVNPGEFGVINKVFVLIYGVNLGATHKSCLDCGLIPKMVSKVERKPLPHGPRLLNWWSQMTNWAQNRLGSAPGWQIGQSRIV